MDRMQEKCILCHNCIYILTGVEICHPNFAVSFIIHKCVNNDCYLHISRNHHSIQQLATRNDIHILNINNTNCKYVNNTLIWQASSSLTFTSWWSSVPHYLIVVWTPTIWFYDAFRRCNWPIFTIKLHHRINIIVRNVWVYVSMFRTTWGSTLATAVWVIYKSIRGVLYN